MVALTVDSLGEDGLIELFSFEGGARGSRLLVPNGDDAAVWAFQSKDASVITTDHQIEGVHFDCKYTSPIDIGRKLMSVNLSDVAAMGARPRYALLGVAIPPHVEIAFAKGIARGIREQCKEHGVAVIGGNTTTTVGPINLSATLIGRAEPDQVVRRRGTQLGDAIYVTGHVGDARLGLRVAQSEGSVDEDSPWFTLYRALVDPRPRVRVGRSLGQMRLAHAMCDVSDGLGRDLRRLLVPERLGARLQAHRLPVSPAFARYCTQHGLQWETEALKGGEDYELLFTADPQDEEEILQVCQEAATPVCRIGVVTESLDIETILADGSVVSTPTGFEHFGDDK